MTSQSEAWDNVYRQSGLIHPPEYLMRVMAGKYPRLALNKEKYPSQRLLDIGCGTGSSFPFYRSAGFAAENLAGVEITQAIVDKLKENLAPIGLDAVDARVGSNASLPFADRTFDYVVTWNSCYYMGDNRDFQRHVREYARVLKPGGRLVFSIPKASCFIFRDSVPDVCPGYRVVANDYFKIRNGVTLRCFVDEQDVRDAFSTAFEDFTFGSICDDCFGLNYHWHIGCCVKGGV